MAQVVNTHIIGPHTCRPTDAQIATLKNYDRANGSPGLHELVKVPASFFILPLFVFTTANNNGKSSAKIKAPRPFTIYAIDAACESAAGSAGTVDVKVDNTSILDAAIDVKTTAGTAVRDAPEAASAAVAYDQTVHITQTGTGSGDMVGGQAYLYCQLL